LSSGDRDAASFPWWPAGGPQRRRDTGRSKKALVVVPIHISRRRRADRSKAIDAMNGSQTVTFVSGDVDASGQNSQLRLEVDDAPDPIDLRLRTGDLAHVIDLLLLWGTKVPHRVLQHGLANTLEAAGRLIQ